MVDEYMVDETDKDKLIRDLGREVAELNFRILEERQASCEEHGRVRTLLTSLYERLVDADAKAQVSRVLQEMSDDLSGRSRAGETIEGPNKTPNHEGKRAIH